MGLEAKNPDGQRTLEEHMETSKIFDTIGRNIDELVIDLLLPARAERKVYRKAFDRFYQQLDQLILALGNERQMPRKLSGLLILIYVDLASNIRRRNQESPISKEVKNYENYLNQIFEDPFAKEGTRKDPILFYRIRDEYGCFSNFAPYGIEKNTSDHYRGCGTSGEGKNMLGKILMQTRKEFMSFTE